MRIDIKDPSKKQTNWKDDCIHKSIAGITPCAPAPLHEMYMHKKVLIFTLAPKKEGFFDNKPG